MIESTVAAELPRGVVLADSGYGHNGGFREGLEKLDLARVLVLRWLPRCPCCLRPPGPDGESLAAGYSDSATGNWQQQC